MRGKNSSRWHCKPCNKTAFGSESRAEETMQWAVEQGTSYVPVRVYPCPFHNGYHLSSQEDRERIRR